MWYCLNCKSIFEEPKQIIDYVIFDPYPDGYRISVCPYCQSDEFIEAIECDSCGEYIVGEYIQLNCDDSCYCEDCYTKKDNT